MRHVFLLIFLAFLACKTVPFSPDSYQKDFVSISEGGGFVGIETHYHFTPLGNVYQQMGMDTTLQKLPDVDREIVRQVLKMARQMELDKYEFDDPGNAYKALTINLEGKKNRIVWSPGSTEVNPSCSSIFKLLKQSLNENDDE